MLNINNTTSKIINVLIIENIESYKDDIIIFKALFMGNGSNVK